MVVVVFRVVILGVLFIWGFLGLFMYIVNRNCFLVVFMFLNERWNVFFKVFFMFGFFFYCIIFFLLWYFEYVFLVISKVKGWILVFLSSIEFFNLFIVKVFLKLLKFNRLKLDILFKFFSMVVIGMNCISLI